MYCSRCGSEITGSLEMCLRCGAPVRVSSQQSKTGPTAASNASKSRTHAGPRTAGPGSDAASRPQPRASSRPSATGVAQHSRQEKHGETQEQGSNWLGALLFIVIGLFVIVPIIRTLFDLNEVDPGQRTAVDSRPAPPSQLSTQSESSSAPATRPSESKPPPGTDRLLNTHQIRYCLAEDWRLEGMREGINFAKKSEVDRFNSLINDFNSRCGEYQYYESSLAEAKNSLQGREQEYRGYGEQVVSGWRQSTDASGAQRAKAEAPRKVGTPDPLVRQAQEILSDLGYNPGPIDGIAGNNTVTAFRRFQRDYGFQVTGRIDRNSFDKLYELRPRIGKEPKKGSAAPVKPNDANENDLLGLNKTPAVSQKDTGRSQASRNYFSIGSHKDEVLRVQGKPQNQTVYREIDEEVWNYPGGQVTFSTRTQRVTHYNNYANGLKTRIN